MGNAPVHTRLPPRYRELERRVVWNDGSARCPRPKRTFRQPLSGKVCQAARTKLGITQFDNRLPHRYTISLERNPDRTMEGQIMSQTLNETKPQVWRALVVFTDGSEMLLYLGRSSAQVRANYQSAFEELLDEEERSRVQTIQMQRWHGTPDAGHWLTQATLSIPAAKLVKTAG
jgi:hypothetical protein